VNAFDAACLLFTCSTTLLEAPFNIIPASQVDFIAGFFASMQMHQHFTWTKMSRKDCNTIHENYRFIIRKTLVSRILISLGGRSGHKKFRRAQT
jgi:hypothetical protein